MNTRLFGKWIVSVWLGAGAVAPSFAQVSWPSKPLRLVVPFPASTPEDVIARALAPHLQQTLGQPVIVDNKPGAGGNIGMADVAHATDGHSVLMAIDSVYTINPHIYKKLPANPVQDLVPVSRLTSVGLMLVCHPGVPARTLSDLLTAARKANFTYASGGGGTPGHMTMALLLATTQSQMTHVPYRGPAAAMQDVLGGTTSCGFLAGPTVAPMTKEGKLTALAVSTPRRMPNYPLVPTAAEAGVSGFEAVFSSIAAMPKGTPPDHVKKLQEALSHALKQTNVRATLATMDVEPVGSTSEEAARYLSATSRKWGGVAEKIGLQID